MPSEPNRRDVMKYGLAAGLATAGVASAADDKPMNNPVAAMKDPKEGYPKPPFEPQSQDAPGLARDMKPPPDHGETSYRGSGRLTGRRALVTGGDSGIGRAAAIAFAREGADVAINYLPVEEPDAQDVKKTIEADGRKCVLIPGDLTDEAFCGKLVEQAVAGLGGLDILVNNAATQRNQPSLEALTTEQFDRVFKTNVYAMFWVTKAAMKHLKPGASIIITSSIQGYESSSNNLDYAMTKACNISFVKGLSKQLYGKGIRVNGIAPGPIWTPIQVISGNPNGVVNMGKGSAVGRPGQPVELAGAYVLLASNESSFVSGEVYGVTGGMMTP
jgi:NAD(P)-dependent dehydrogenase (short-subunit alcohol dehydrogenase family)